MSSDSALNPGAANTPQTLIISSAIAAAMIGLFFSARINYLLFHSLAEIFSVVVAFSLFVIAWNSKQYIRNPYLLFVGIAYLFIAFLDLLHTLSFPGMPIFTEYEYHANQLWIGARYMESITLLLAFAFLRRDRLPRPNLVFAGYTLVTIVLCASIFYWKIFPVCFIEGSGLTTFKIVSEYVICAILIACILLLYRHRERFEEKVFRLLLLSLIFTIASELAFTYYIHNYGFSNLVGHYCKIFSFLLIYAAIIKTGIEKPYELIFLDLAQANSSLKEEVANRIAIQKQNESLIDDLTGALERIRTLEGILPTCMHCKQIRDDQGNWNQMEKYISSRSAAKFSHGICPACLQKHYPDGL